MICRSCHVDHDAARRQAIACTRNSLDGLLRSTFALLPDDVEDRLARREKPAPEPVILPWPRSGFQLDVAFEMGTV